MILGFFYLGYDTGISSPVVCMIQGFLHLEHDTGISSQRKQVFSSRVG